MFLVNIIPWGTMCSHKPTSCFINLVLGCQGLPPSAGDGTQALVPLGKPSTTELHPQPSMSGFHEVIAQSFQAFDFMNVTIYIHTSLVSSFPPYYLFTLHCKFCCSDTEKKKKRQLTATCQLC
jgi:hypothetical protein